MRFQEMAAHCDAVGAADDNVWTTRTGSGRNPIATLLTLLLCYCRAAPAPTNKNGLLREAPGPPVLPLCRKEPAGTFVGLTTNGQMPHAYRLSEDERRERSERMKRRRADPVLAAKNAATSRATLLRLHADPEFATRHAAAAGERMRRLHTDPQFAAKQAAAASETLRRLNADPDFVVRNAAAASERMKRRRVDPAFAAKQAAAAGETLRRLHADPAFAARHAAAASERMQRRHTDPEFRKKLLKALTLGRARRPYGDYWKRGEPHPGF